ncbi:hypothetical protein D9M73_78030 [compost metagenome]
MIERAAGRAGDAVLAIGFGSIICGLEPFAPRLFRFWRQQFAIREALILGEARRAFADQQRVRGLFHHAARDRNGVHGIFERGDRADPAGIVHDDGVERDVTVAVGIAAIADGMVVRVRFRHHRPGFDRIEQRSAAGQLRIGSVVCGRAKVPGRDNLRGRPGRYVGQGFGGGQCAGGNAHHGEQGSSTGHGHPGSFFMYDHDMDA